MKYLFSIFLLTCFLISPATAQEEKAAQEKVEETPITKWIDAENELLDTLPRGNREVFFIFRNKHSVIRSINIVRRDIQAAVRACGTENHDMKKQMNARFKQWENAVLPILKEAEKFLQKELKEQEAFHLSDYRHVMKLNDKAYEFSDSKIQKNPVTSKEACEGLLNSMDSTEDRLVTLLQNILLPEEVVRERLEQQKKAQEKAKSDS